MTLNARLNWKEHIKKKQTELNLKYKKLKWIIGRNSKVTTANKLLIYNQIIKPVWTYGSQLWGCAAKTHVETIQLIQNKILRDIVNAPWYARNDDIHRDLGVTKVAEATKQAATNHTHRLQHHNNPETSTLCNEENY